MRFRQPNDLSRVLHRVLSDLLEGRSVSFRFDSEAQLAQVLMVLQEVAASRQVVVKVRPTGRRELELTLEETPMSASV